MEDKLFFKTDVHNDTKALSHYCENDDTVINHHKQILDEY